MHRAAYRSLVRVVHRLPVPTGKVARSVAGRRAARKRWVAWGQNREPGPLAWMHAASVGEMLAAVPVAARLRAARPELQVVFSFSSASAERWTPPPSAAYADYVPLDEPREIAAVLDAVRPNLLVFSRGDLWPELMGGAQGRGVPIALTGARVSARSGRLHWPLRQLLAPLTAQIRYAGTVGLEDAGRLRAMGIAPEVLHVTGDPRHDYVVERHVDLTSARLLAGWKADTPVLVAGSVEGSDAPSLADATAATVRSGACRLCLVPHQPTAAGRMLRRWSGMGIKAVPWSGRSSPVPDAQVLVVNELGGLFDLYAAADVAFVGGGFRRGGLHAVSEPAAFGLPVTFGPHWRGDPDAAALVATGGGVAADTARELREALARWLGDEAARITAGMAARGTIRPGAAGQDARALLQLLDQAAR